MAKGQPRFKNEHATIDHLVTLRAIVEDDRGKKHDLICCFVDFRKAFDAMPRTKLARD
jgi:hypothetical protein